MEKAKLNMNDQPKTLIKEEAFIIEKQPQFNDLWGRIMTLTSPPTYIPTKVYQQIVLVTGTPSSLYVYEPVSNRWKVFGSNDNL